MGTWGTGLFEDDDAADWAWELQCGRPAQGLPEEVSAWIAAHDSLPAAPRKWLAKRVAERIRTDSELRELWEESDDWNGWSANVDDLLRRLA